MDTNRAFVAGAVLLAWGALAACRGSDTIEQRTGPGGASNEITPSTGGSVGAATVGQGGAGGMGGVGGSIGEGGSGSSGAGGIGGVGGASTGCSADLDCNDFIDCTLDTCVAGTCNHDPDSTRCADGKDCNGVEVCDPALGCVETSESCDDGEACNGVETCDPKFGCTSGAPVDCDDGIPCTYDLCQDPAGTCIHYPQDHLCDDGTFCNGVEVCDPIQGCIKGPPVTCNDNIACTDDVCDERLDTCKGVPNNALCPCNETCDPSQGGCGDFCEVATCQGTVHTCGDCVDNDGDCKADTEDEQCLDPCDDTEQ